MSANQNDTNSGRRKKQRIDWARYTDFKSHHLKEDLAKLCAGLKREQLAEVFRTYDETGLCPIHWAAIHNRSDLIEIMADNGSLLRIKCRNKLFADGSPIHLAAMNGSIEAASMLLRRSKVEPPAPGQSTDDWLAERDAEGQTPLMRSAAPRSKRMDIVRDLLRKNLWSLSARPSEMALFLISQGADWREKEPNFSMNLLHLAITNDYDDIVHLLLVIDKQLLSVPAKLSVKPKVRSASPITTLKPPSNGFQTVDLGSNSSSASSLMSLSSLAGSSANRTGEGSLRPLIGRQETAESLLRSGLQPLELAIVYGRLNIISLLWNAVDRETTKDGSKHQQSNNFESKELSNILKRVLWSSEEGLFRLLRGTILKFALLLDVTALILIWMPVYLSNSEGNKALDLRDGVFIISFCITLVLTFRVIMKNPGYLQRNSPHYFEEVAKLTGRSDRQDKPQVASTNGQRQLDKLELEEKVRLLCHRCQIIRQLRSRHCNYCNRCVQDFDHHCIYLGCCVGRDNRLDFLIMLLSVSLTAIYGTTIQATSMSRDQWAQVWHFIGLIWVSKYAVIGSLNAFFMLRRACLGITMYEEIRSDRIRRLFGPEGTPASIDRTHKIYSIEKGSFWRYSPNRYLTGDLPLRKIFTNLRQFTNNISLTDYMTLLACSDSPLARSIANQV